MSQKFDILKQMEIKFDKDLIQLRDSLSMCEDRGIDIFEIDGTLTSIVGFVGVLLQTLNDNKKL